MAAAAVETRNPLVLIVEDDPDIQLLVSTSLERGGYTVRTASDGREALSSINDTIPDLIISDVMMPELDGLELLSILRNDPATRRVPVILLTAKGSTSDIVTGFDLGADDYLPKPFVVRELQARVRAKVERPPVPIDEVVRERHLTILPLQSFETELAREIMRTRRGGGIGSLAVLEIAELSRIRERLGGRAEAALVRQVGTAIAEDGRALDSTGRDKHGRFLLLMPETRTEGAEIRLRRLAQLLVRQAFVVGGESVRLTPVIGYVEYGPGVTSENVLEKAMTALDHAAAHLDLEPVRYQESMGLRESDGRSALAALGRAVALRLPVQVAAVHLLGLVLPFLAYLGLDRIGFNIVPVMYFVVVVSLLVTATLIWVEGFHSLQVRNPPEPDSAPPPVTGIIAAYLPNEAATIVDTVESFLRSDYPGDYQVILAYNTPRDLPVEGTLQRIAARDPRFIPMRVENSTSKAQNVNAALAEARGEIIGVFDADHHPAPNAFTRAWKWIASGYDIVQGHCVVRNGVESGVARLVAVEFEAIYAVAHPGRARLHDFGIFGGSNGYWRADLLRQTRMHGFMLTEDIDSSIRVVTAGYRICSDPGLISEELAPVSLKSFWNQRMRWAQGWFQVSRKHLGIAMRSRTLSLRQKLGVFHLLWWREVYPWLSIQMWPIIAYWIVKKRGAENVDWFVPIFVLTTLFTLSVGPGQVLFAWLNSAPQIRQHRSWFWRYLLLAPFYSEYKNVIARVAQAKELIGDRQWKVTPRSTVTRPHNLEPDLEDESAFAGLNAVPVTLLSVSADQVPDAVQSALDLATPQSSLATPQSSLATLLEDVVHDGDWHVVNGELIADGTGETPLRPLPLRADAPCAVEAGFRLMLPDHASGVFELLVGLDPATGVVTDHTLGAGISVDGPGRSAQIVVTRGHDLLAEFDTFADTSWRTLRIELRDGTATVLVDGSVVREMEYEASGASQAVGLWSDQLPVRIRSVDLRDVDDRSVRGVETAELAAEEVHR